MQWVAWGNRAFCQRSALGLSRIDARRSLRLADKDYFGQWAEELDVTDEIQRLLSGGDQAQE